MRNKLLSATAILVVALICSCHPAKQLQTQDENIEQLKAKWIGDWVLKNPCPPYPSLNLDSLCAVYYKVGPYDSGFFIGLNEEPPTPIDIDAIIKPDGVRTTHTIMISGQPHNVLVPYEDTRTLNLLKDSIKNKDVEIAGLRAAQATRTDDCSSQVKAAQKQTTKWIWLFIAACVVLGGGLAISVYKMLHGGSISKIL